MIRWIKRLTGKHDESYEYWVKTSDIKILDQFLAHKVSKKKLQSKKEYYYLTGDFESPIIISNDFVLLDGYSSYVIGAKVMGMEKLPVHFRNTMDGKL